MSSWLVPPAVALVVVVGLTPLVMKLARARGWVAHPRKDRWHRTPTALMGGIAIFAAASAGWALLGPEGPLRWIWLGGGLLFLLGFLDDRHGVTPVAKLVGQLAGAGVLL
jgi:UDP-GlcNAc:undecaprenyl-phosphate/decaprenyl-phosphate GlcNAc-1-phosphate transferase